MSLVPVTPELRRLRDKDCCKFEACFDFVMKPCLINKTKQSKQDSLAGQ